MSAFPARLWNIKRALLILLAFPEPKRESALGTFIEQERPARQTRLVDPGANVLATFNPNAPTPVRGRPEVVMSPIP